jgi:choline kinase
MTRVAMPAAGMGRRLGREPQEPKALLRFDGESLLARHLRILRHFGLERLDMAVGFRAEAIEGELRRLGAGDRVRRCYNPHYAEGSVLSLAALRPAFTAGETVLFMDADVLYDHRLLAPLLHAEVPSAFLMDTAAGIDDEAVKLCLAGGRPVDFGKSPSVPHDRAGEWIGFARFAPDTAAEIADIAERYVAAGRRDAPYEDVFRDVLRAAAPGRVQAVDIAGLPWIEIDFPQDLKRAEHEVLPRLEPLPP